MEREFLVDLETLGNRISKLSHAFLELTAGMSVSATFSMSRMMLSWILYSSEHNHEI